MHRSNSELPIVTNEDEIANEDDCVSNLVKNSKQMSRIKRSETGGEFITYQ